MKKIKKIFSADEKKDFFGRHGRFGRFLENLFRVLVLLTENDPCVPSLCIPKTRGQIVTLSYVKVAFDC